MPIAINALAGKFRSSPRIVKTGTFGNARKMERDVNAFPVHRTGKAIRYTRHIGIFDRGHILLTDFTVTIQILIQEVTQTGRSDFIHFLGLLQFFRSIDEAISIAVINLISEQLSDAISGFTVTIRIIFGVNSLIHVALLVLVVGKISFQRE